MNTDLMERAQELISRGEKLVSRIPSQGQYGPAYWFRTQDLSDLRSWIGSVTNLVEVTTTPDSYFAKQCQRIINDDQMSGGVPHHSVMNLIGLLKSLLEEYECGLLTKAEYIFVSITFDTFIDHAADYHKGGKKIESAVLTCAVFEDTVRKLAEKYEVDQKGKPLDGILDELGKNGHLSPVKIKRYKGFSGLRNSALHAQWDEFDLRDVGSAISGVREMIELLS